MIWASGKSTAWWSISTSSGKKALNIALNKIQGDWDESKLASLMAEFDAEAFDVSLTGFDAEEVDATMLHEMPHLYNLTHGIKDVSNNGYYHNKKFKETAEAYGLAISHHHTYGWTVTDLTPETAAWIAQQPELSDIAANCQTTLQIKIKGDDDSGEDGETTTTIKGGRSTSKNRSIKYVCPKCGAIIRATKLVNVVCGDCDVAFEIAK